MAATWVIWLPLLGEKAVHLQYIPLLAPNDNRSPFVGQTFLSVPAFLFYIQITDQTRMSVLSGKSFHQFIHLFQGIVEMR